MNNEFTVYTVTASNGSDTWIVGHTTTEAAAEALASDIPDSTITAASVPLPDLVIDIQDGYVTRVTTTDGIEVTEVTVHDYDTEGLDGEDDNGTYAEYTL